MPIKRLTEQLAVARETIRQLKKSMEAEELPLYADLHFSHNEGVVLGALLKAEGACARTRLIDKLELASREGTIYSTSHLNVIIHRLRMKLMTVDIVIETVYGIGFAMALGAKTKMRALKRRAIVA
jgi:hypothetical protein